MRLEELNDLPPRESRRAGAILGLAVGDALGATYEFRSAREVPEGPLEMVGGGWLDLEPGETTDDTALARTVLEGYRGGYFELRRVREAMLGWEETDPPDIGNQTRMAFHHLRRNPGDLALPDAPRAQGNGAVMRAAAHGVMAASPEAAVENAWREAALTHPSEAARASSALVAGTTACLIGGIPATQALEASTRRVADRTKTDVRDLFAPDIRDLLEEYPMDTARWGWTVHTTRLALGCLLDARDFRTSLEGVIRLGGDADTNGAVTGALLGARFGIEAIPPEWSGELVAKEELVRLL